MFQISSRERAVQCKIYEHIYKPALNRFARASAIYNKQRRQIQQSIVKAGICPSATVVANHPSTQSYPEQQLTARGSTRARCVLLPCIRWVPTYGWHLHTTETLVDVANSFCLSSD